MTNEQEIDLNSARSHLRHALDVIEALFDDASATQEDIDSDMSEAVNECNQAIEYLYDAKPRGRR